MSRYTEAGRVTPALGCPNPGKRSYFDRSTAEAEGKRIMAYRNWGVGYGLLHAYRCQCRRWHLTTKEQVP